MPRLKTTRTTAKQRIDTASRKRIQNAYKFIDPFPLGFGTRPEKMVYYALTKFGIPFYYLNDISFSLPEIDFFKEYQADFIIPSTKVIIEVQGAYWHSKPAAIESDSYKLAVYESFGYTAIAWWDYEIEQGIDDLILLQPLLTSAFGLSSHSGGETAELTPMKRTKTDTSKGIRTMNANKRKPYRTFVGAGKRSVRKVKSSYAVTQ